MSEENNNNNNSKEVNKNEISSISQDNCKQDLMKKLKEIHRKSEERTFDLNEKFNQIKDGLQKLIDTYQNDLYEDNESDNNIDIISLHRYMNNYLNNERETSINNINNVFEQISDKLNTKSDKNMEEKEDMKTSLIEIKNEFDAIYEETVNHHDETKNQKDDIKNKIDIQMEEQLDKVNDILYNDIEIGEKSKNDIINVTQKFLKDLGMKMKKEKIERSELLY
jgi:hypothetical protein